MFVDEENESDDSVMHRSLISRERTIQITCIDVRFVNVET